MTIKIAERYRPFTHIPGAKFILPGSKSTIEVYPTKVLIDGKEHLFAVFGLVKHFTAYLDLEKGQVIVTGEASGKFFRFTFGDKRPPEPLERLSFGCTKQQNLEKIYQRNTPEEFLPIWFLAGQQVPATSVPPLQNSGSLTEFFKDLFQAGFSAGFYPETEDVHHLGASLPPLSHPISLLSAGYHLIKETLVREDTSVYILPQPLSKAGRAINLKLSFGTLDLEWTKGCLRRVVLHSLKNETVTLEFPKSLRQARLNDNQRISLPEVKLHLQASKIYHFDHFT